MMQGTSSSTPIIIGSLSILLCIIKDNGYDVIDKGVEIKNILLNTVDRNNLLIDKIKTGNLIYS